MNLRYFLKLSGIILLLDICLVYSQDVMVNNDVDPDYIECYWCNSRDVYCGKRVIDTMVTTIKCPKQSRCVVYTNPYDNYYLHRGCTYGMDLGEMEVQNGCFVEEEGSTYCFCDFNRCNAAGILDLRNLIEEKNNTVQRIKINKDDKKANFVEMNYLKDEEILRGQNKNLNNNNNSNNKITNPNYYLPDTNEPDLYNSLLTKTSGSDTSLFPFRTSFNSNTNDFSRFLTHLFNESTTNSFDLIKNENLKNQILNNINENENFIRTFEDYTNRLKTTIKKANQTQYENTLKNIEFTNKPKIINQNNQNLVTKSYSPMDLFKQYNKLSTRVYTRPSTTRNMTLLTSKYNQPISTFTLLPLSINNNNNNNNNVPLLYKLKINDSFSKNILENLSIRSKLGMKPNDKLSILIKRPLGNGEQNINPNEDLNLNFYNQKPYFYENNLNNNNNNKYTTKKITTSTSSWLSKLKAKLSQTFTQTTTTTPFSMIQPITNSVNDWTHILNEKYKEGLKINFKCPRDGLYSHPKNCSQFLQCVDFGTMHERFYVLNCPSGLYFNQKLELCDYVENVLCLN